MRIGPIPFGLYDHEPVPRATGFLIHIGPDALSQDIDDSDLMHRDTGRRWQRNTALQAGLDMPQQRRDCEGFQFNPSAAEYQPSANRIVVLPDQLQDLHAAWLRTAFSWEGEAASTASTIVMTWYVDQHKFHQCAAPRPVLLHDDFETWEAQMKRAWADIVASGTPILINMIQPQQPNIDHETAAHVLLVGNPADALSRSLVAAYDATIRHSGPFFQIATTTSEHILLHLVTNIGLANRCLHANSPMECTAWCDQYVLTYGNPFLGHDGSGIIMTIHQRTSQQFGLATYFLQTRARYQISLEERLTHGQVTHTHGPSNTASSEVEEETAVKLLDYSGSYPTMPTFITVQDPATVAKIHDELKNLALKHSPFFFMALVRLLCSSTSTSNVPEYVHYVHVHHGKDAFFDDDAVLTHSDSNERYTMTSSTWAHYINLALRRQSSFEQLNTVTISLRLDTQRPLATFRRMSHQ